MKYKYSYDYLNKGDQLIPHSLVHGMEDDGENRINYRNTVSRKARDKQFICLLLYTSSGDVAKPLS